MPENGEYKVYVESDFENATPEERLEMLSSTIDSARDAYESGDRYEIAKAQARMNAVGEFFAPDETLLNDYMDAEYIEDARSVGTRPNLRGAFVSISKDLDVAPASLTERYVNTLDDAVMFSRDTPVSVIQMATLENLLDEYIANTEHLNEILNDDEYESSVEEDLMDIRDKIKVEIETGNDSLPYSMMERMDKADGMVMGHILRGDPVLAPKFKAFDQFNASMEMNLVTEKTELDKQVEMFDEIAQAYQNGQDVDPFNINFRDMLNNSVSAAILSDEPAAIVLEKMDKIRGDLAPIIEGYGNGRDRFDDETFRGMNQFDLMSQNLTSRLPDGADTYVRSFSELAPKAFEKYATSYQDTIKQQLTSTLNQLSTVEEFGDFGSDQLEADLNEFEYDVQVFAQSPMKPKIPLSTMRLMDMIDKHPNTVEHFRPTLPQKFEEFDKHEANLTFEQKCDKLAFELPIRLNGALDAYRVLGNAEEVVADINGIVKDVNDLVISGNNRLVTDNLINAIEEPVTSLEMGSKYFDAVVAEELPSHALDRVSHMGIVMEGQFERAEAAREFASDMKTLSVRVEDTLARGQRGEIVFSDLDFEPVIDRLDQLTRDGEQVPLSTMRAMREIDNTVGEPTFERAFPEKFKALDEYETLHQQVEVAPEHPKLFTKGSEVSKDVEASLER